MALPDRIKQAREARKLSPTDLGAAVGASAHAVLSWEAGRRKPSGTHQARLCRVLGLEPWMFAGAWPPIVPRPSGQAQGGHMTVAQAVKPAKLDRAIQLERMRKRDLLTLWYRGPGRHCLWAWERPEKWSKQELAADILDEEYKEGP